MADTVSTLTSDAAITFPDLTTTLGERYANQVHNMVLSELGIRDTSRDISLTDGTREYSMNEADIQIKAAYYIASASADDHSFLQATSEDWLDLNSPGWRNRSAEDRPSRFYTKSGKSSNNTIKQIGFDPIPGTTTSAGYPVVRVYITQNVTLTSTDTVPIELSCSQVYLDGMRWLHCKNTRREEEADYWYKKFRQSMDYEKQYVKGRIRHLNTSWNLSGMVKGASIV